MLINKKLVCINTDEYYKDFLTYGKIYDATWLPVAVYSSEGIYWNIINDIGERKQYHESKFTTLQKWREQKLDKIF